MSKYIDGFVIPVPKDKMEEYQRIAEIAGDVWKSYGALEYWECVMEDPTAKDMVSFPQLASAGPDETVVFSWIMYESREHRDEVSKKVMEDPRIFEMMKEGEHPFDCSRMAYGGFTSIVQR